MVVFFQLLLVAVAFVSLVHAAVLTGRSLFAIPQSRMLSPIIPQVTDNGLLVLHQKGKDAVHWPLKSLRRYGAEADVFSFESGRKCKTGPGIYAFR